MENQTLFSPTDWLPEDAAGSLLYYTGTLSDLQLAWLAHHPRAPRIYYVADYDGVGLLNYVKLRQASGAPVEFWLMPGWRELLRRYGSAELWRRTRQQAESAAARLAVEQWPQTVRELRDALTAEGVALEHEGVWLAGRDETGLPRQVPAVAGALWEEGRRSPGDGEHVVLAISLR